MDTSGFTPLTIRLTERGRDGAEVLADILLAVFEPLIEAVYAHGGFIAGFAGDAFKAVFPGLAPDTYLHALAAAAQIRTHMARHPRHETRYGIFDFGVRMSIADGQVTWAVWSGDEIAAAQSCGYTFSGPALDQAIQGEDYAEGGELVVTHTFFAALQAAKPDTIVGEALAGEAEGYVCIDQVTDALPAPQPVVADAPASLLNASRFFPATLLTMPTQGEFRPVYTLFVNVQTLPEPGADEDFLPLLFQLLRQYGGYLCRIGRIGANDPGGTFLLFWGAPTSHENDLHRVLSFLLELRRQTAIALRAGVTHAIVYAGFVGSPLRAEYTCYGASVNQAARQMAAAQWGQILLDADTARRAQDGFEVTLAGRYTLKGLAGEQALFTLQGQQRQRDAIAYETVFIGRTGELTQLQTAIQPIFQGRFGGLTLVSGEAGIGKSRLVHEAVTTLSRPETQQKMQIFLCQTDEILRESLNPFRHFLRRYFDQSPGAGEPTNKANFTATLDALIAITPDETLRRELERTRPFLGALVNLHWPGSPYERLEPQLRFENTLSALKMLLLAESLRQPVLLLLEDAHWLDEDSRAFLALLTRNVDAYPLAVIVTTRPPEEGDAPPLPTEIVQQEIVLASLSTTEIGELARDHLGGAASPALATLLMARAEGNPFFAEQMLLYLQEQSLLVRDQQAWRLADEIGDDTALPDNVQSVLIARLDRLAQEVKQVVQTAAVLGREFSVQVLSQMLRGDTALDEKVQSAQDAAVWSALSELRYLFRHTLLREAAYEMQLRTTLRVLHQTAAQAIETLFAHNLAEYYADLVYHYQRSEAPEQERHYALLAGRQAAELYANTDALTYFTRALELTPETELAARFELHLERVRLYDVLGARDQQETEVAHLEELAEQLDNDSLRAKAALQRAECAMALSDYSTMLSAAQRAVVLASQDRELAADGYIKWGNALIWQGNYGAAQSQLEQARRLTQDTHTRQEADTYHQLGLVAMQRGDNAESRRYLAHALPIYRELADSVNEGYVLTVIGLSHRNEGRVEQAIDHLQQALAVWRTVGFRRGELVATGNLGHGYLDQGDYTSAYRQYAGVYQLASDMRDRYHMATVLNNLGLVTGHLGDYATARTHYEEALAIRRAIGAKQGVSLTARNLGFLLSKLGEHELALAYCNEALAIAEELHSPVDKGMAAYRLGRVLFALQRWDAARAAYQSALPLLQDKPQLAVEVLAGLVELALAQQEVNQQQEALEEMVRYLETRPVGINEPAYVHWICYQALHELGDPRADRLLAFGYNLIQERAALIENESWRRSYLDQIAVHRDILERQEATTRRRPKIE
ncbi:MAG: hypothetical protein DCC55_35520 [Chloroflexi bacterium]|nr:MAG: hypothetical protein DCC55_35520 [Chloroflexota bacterium]